ncbi:hypothetical protein ABK040_000188 [Willaertia magna]
MNELHFLSLQQANSTGQSNSTFIAGQVYSGMAISFIQLASFALLLLLLIVFLILSIRVKSNYKTVLFSLVIASTVILLVSYLLRTIITVKYPVETFSRDQPLFIKVINGIVASGIALNDVFLLAQFLFISYVLAKQVSQVVHKRILYASIFIELTMIVSTIGLIVVILINRVYPKDNNVSIALKFFFTLQTVVFISTLLITLSFVIWDTIKIIQQLKHHACNGKSNIEMSESNKIEQAKTEMMSFTKKAINKASLILALISLTILFLCALQILYFVGEIAGNGFVTVASFIAKALASWVFIFCICMLFNPLAGIKERIKEMIEKAENLKNNNYSKLNNEEQVTNINNSTEV